MERVKVGDLSVEYWESGSPRWVHIENDGPGWGRISFYGMLTLDVLISTLMEIQRRELASIEKEER